jgi:hypothetical protein
MSIFGGASPPPPPPPPPAPPTFANASVQSAGNAAEMAARAAAAQGTISTGPQGAALAPTAGKALLGM